MGWTGRHVNLSTDHRYENDITKYQVLSFEVFRHADKINVLVFQGMALFLS